MLKVGRAYRDLARGHGTGAVPSLSRARAIHTYISSPVRATAADTWLTVLRGKCVYLKSTTSFPDRQERRAVMANGSVQVRIRTIADRNFTTHDL